MPARVNGTVAVLAKLVLILGWMVQGSRASSLDSGAGLEVSFPWELYTIAGLYEAMLILQPAQGLPSRRVHNKAKGQVNDDSEPCLRASSFTLHRGMTGILSLKLALYIVVHRWLCELSMWSMRHFRTEFSSHRSVVTHTRGFALRYRAQSLSSTGGFRSHKVSRKNCQVRGIL